MQMENGSSELPVKPRTSKALALLSLKRTFDLFAGNFTYGQRTAADTESQKLKLSCKVLFGLCTLHGKHPAEQCFLWRVLQSILIDSLTSMIQEKFRAP